MAKRTRQPPSESSLSSAPDDLAVDVKTEEAKVSKTEIEASTTVKTIKSTKRPHPSNGVDQAPASKRATKKVKVEETAEEDVEVKQNGTAKAKAKKTTTRKKEVDLAPLEDRTTDTKLRVGAHVSAAGGVHMAITNLLHIGANSFALFLKSQRKWENPDLKPEVAELFIEGCKKHNIDASSCCVPHGSYLVNLANPDPEKKKQSYDAFHNDLTRCAKLGIKLYNFHPGNASNTTHENGIKTIAANLNQAIADPATGDVMILLETMATKGNCIGGTFEDIAAIIDLVDNKDRIGVCLDTCHIFAAGYDLRDPDAYSATVEKFDETIGLNYLKAFHMNDSKAPFGSHRDLHANIGTGFLGLRAFHNIVNDGRLHGLPMVLETPIDVVGKDGKTTEDRGIWAREIKLLESLVGMDVESEEFKKLETTLQEQGKGFRDTTSEQFERKKAKEAKQAAKKEKKK